MSGLFSLFEMAAKLQGIAEDLTLAPEQIIERGCQIIEKEAKASLGSYHRNWPQLAQSTQADRVRQGFPANEPGLRTGAMRDSIGHTVSVEGDQVVGVVGSNDDHLVWFELGTSRGEPPRPVLMGAAMRKEKQVVEMALGRVAAAFGGRGAAAREWRELAGAVKHAAHAAKKLWYDAVQPDDDDDRQGD
jgi:hypothetical protein